MINETLMHLKECYDKQTLIIKESEKQIEDASNQKVAILDTFKDSLLEYLSANFTRKWMREIAPYSSKEIYHFVISFEKGSGDSVVAMSSQTLYVSADKTPVVENARAMLDRLIVMADPRGDVQRYLNKVGEESRLNFMHELIDGSLGFMFKEDDVRSMLEILRKQGEADGKEYTR